MERLGNKASLLNIYLISVGNVIMREPTFLPLLQPLNPTFLSVFASSICTQLGSFSREVPIQSSLSELNTVLIRTGLQTQLTSGTCPVQDDLWRQYLKISLQTGSAHYSWSVGFSPMFMP